MNFLKWLFKDAEPKVTNDRNDVVTGAARRLRQAVKDAESERGCKAEEWWERTKNAYLKEIIAECEKLAKEEKTSFSFLIRSHEGFWFPSFKQTLRNEGFQVEDEHNEQYITIRW